MEGVRLKTDRQHVQSRHNQAVTVHRHFKRHTVGPEKMVSPPEIEPRTLSVATSALATELRLLAVILLNIPFTTDSAYSNYSVI